MDRMGRTGDPGIRTWNGLLQLRINGKLQSSYLDYQSPVIIGANAQGRVPYIKMGRFLLLNLKNILFEKQNRRNLFAYLLLSKHKKRFKNK